LAVEAVLLPRCFDSEADGGSLVTMDVEITTADVPKDSLPLGRDAIKIAGAMEEN
jgi:hypothetical protein